MDHNTIAILMFSTMLLMMITGQRVFGAIGVVAVVAALETGVTQLRGDLAHERDLRERLEARVNRLEERLTATTVPR